MAVKIVQGSLLDATEDILGHQVNCQGIMGSGIALALREKYPELYPAYKEFCKGVEPERLLGSLQGVKTDSKIIVNLFGQLNYGRQNVVYTDYHALRKSLQSLVLTAWSSRLSVALPYNIGCGLANGDWKIVEEIIEYSFSDYEVTLYKL